VLATLAGHAVACAPADPPVPATSPVAPTAPHDGPRLRQDGSRLYVTEAPAGAVRGALLYVLAAQPFPGGQSRPKIGLIAVTQQLDADMEVAWVCRPNVPGDIEASGLPVRPIPQDTLTRVGRCVARYLPGEPAAWDGKKDWMDLRIGLGSGDGLRVGDRYEVLGKPIVDESNRMVTEFERAAFCIVQAQDLQTTTCICRVDVGARDFRLTRERFLSGGYVMLDERSKPSEQDHR
jgi:hypothetical protein